MILSDCSVSCSRKKGEISHERVTLGSRAASDSLRLRSGQTTVAGRVGSLCADRAGKRGVGALCAQYSELASELSAQYLLSALRVEYQRCRRIRRWIQNLRTVGFTGAALPG